MVDGRQGTNPRTFIAVAGNIGTGKSTLTRMLAEHFQWEAHFEAVADNPYLVDFYADMKRWSFPLQIYFLTNRVNAHLQITAGKNSAIQDRTIYEDANIFARNLAEQSLMEPRDYETYLAVYETVCRTLQPPDLMIYLKKSLPQLKAQIKKRGRDYEQDISDQYLGDLNRYYDDWIENRYPGKKVIIESDDLDFVARAEDFSLITEHVIANLDQRDLFMRA
jgi:deoxyadenosine/deoxycytidine kinase